MLGKEKQMVVGQKHAKLYTLHFVDDDERQ
jgi:hypothetical protein